MGEPEDVLPVVEESPPLQPVGEGERVQVIDMLRGFALLGILCVNMQFYTTPFPAIMGPGEYWPALHDVIAKRFIRFFAEGKFYTMFSFLFGLGVAVQWTRAEARGQRFAKYHLRRMGVLLVFGLIHAFLIWMGDILVSYALLGCLLLLFLRRRPTTLLVWSAILLAVPIVFFTLLVGTLELASLNPEAAAEIEKALAQPESARQEAVERSMQTYSRGSFADITLLRSEEVLNTYGFLVIVMWPIVLAMFLVGVFVCKRGFLFDPAAHRPLFRRAFQVGLAVGLAGNLVYVVAGEFADYAKPGWSMVIAMTGSTIGAPALSCCYGCGIVLLAQGDRWRRRLTPLASVGRMALTNYLAQSLICTTIFYGFGPLGFGFGLFGTIGPAVGLALTLAIYLVQIAWSHWWTKRFRFGPMEWLWRSLTYGQAQPMRL